MVDFDLTDEQRLFGGDNALASARGALPPAA